MRNAMTTHIHAPETKSAGGEVALAFEDFARTFDAFRQTNDQRLAEIETRLARTSSPRRSSHASTRLSTRPSAGSTASSSTPTGRPWARPRTERGTPAAPSTRLRSTSM
jgi:hypothetical protein